MADILGITRTAYNKYENGAIQPTLNVKKLSRFFNVSTDYLLRDGVGEADLAPALGLERDLRALFPGRAPHDALYDAAACALVLLRLLREPAWSALGPEDLAALS